VVATCSKIHVIVMISIKCNILHTLTSLKLLYCTCYYYNLNFEQLQRSVLFITKIIILLFSLRNSARPSLYKCVGYADRAYFAMNKKIYKCIIYHVHILTIYNYNISYYYDHIGKCLLSE